MSDKMPLAFANAGVPTEVAELAQSLNNFSVDPTGFDGCELLKMGKAGEWEFGLDGFEMSTDDHIAINPSSFEHGFIAWKIIAEENRRTEKPEKLGEIMLPISQPAPHKGSLDNFPNGDWSEQVKFKAQILDGDEAGTELVYKTSSGGGKKATRALTRIMVNRINSGSSFVVPIVSLDSSSYKNKTYGGKTFNPEFKVVYWVNFEGEKEGDQKAIANKPAKKIAQTKAKTKTPEIVEDLVDLDGEEDASALLDIETVNTAPAATEEPENVADVPKPSSRRRRSAR